MTTTRHEKDIEYFDQWANTYERSWVQQVYFDPTHRATLALAAEIVYQPASILDVGCGTGKLLRQTRTYWPEAQLIGVDPANGMVEMAKCLTPNATFFTGMAESLPPYLPSLSYPQPVPGPVQNVSPDPSQNLPAGVYFT